jgi:hypothetical protein
MKRIVSLIVTLLSIASAYSETLPVEEIVNIPATFTDFTGRSYDDCPNASDWCLYYENVFGTVYHPELDENGNLVDNYYSSHDVVKEINIHPSSQATTIGKLAFCYLAALQSITFPQGITSIANDAFQGTKNISTVKVYVTDPAAFCNNLIVAQIRSRLVKPVTLIDSEGFVLNDFVIPEGVTSIGVNAFNNCTGLTSVTIPEGVTAIGASAFAGCTGLTSVIIPASVTSIGSYAFPTSTEIYVPKGQKEFYQDILGPDYRVYEVGMQVNVINNIIYAFDRSSRTAEVVGVNDNTSSTFSILEHFTIKGVNYTVTGIDGHAFKDCQNMTEINMSQTVTSIGVRAFSGCTALTSVTIPEGVTVIKDFTFYDCVALSAVAIPDGVTNIGPSAFYGCGNLTNVNIPSSVTEIGGWAFYGCSVLTKVIVPDIAAWCNISFSSSYANPLIYAHHLYSDANTEYTDVVIPEGVSKIGSYAFSGDAGLTSITIPSNVTSIGKDAFSYCWGLTTLTIPEGVTSIGSCAFWGCTGLTSINIPVGVTTISKELFHGCTSLSRVTIPEGVTSIGEDAFSNCNLSSIIIPSSVTEIGGWAFYKCPLTSVACYRPTPISANSNNFTYYDTATLYVPSGSVEAYQGENPWYNFQNIRAIPDPADVNGDGEVDVADFTLTANYLLGKSPNGFIVIVADVAGAAGGTPDGEIDIADLTGIANIILHSGSAQNTGE